MGRVGVQWDWNKKLVEMGNWHLGGYWESDAGYWNNTSNARTHATILDIGFTPVFRIQQTTRSSVAPYVEAAVGLHCCRPPRSIRSASSQQLSNSATM